MTQSKKRLSARAIRTEAKARLWKHAEDFRLDVDALLQVEREGKPSILSENPHFDAKTYMAAQWEAIDSVQVKYRPRPPRKWDDLREKWDSPFLAMMAYVEHGGNYPPPELLWAVYESFAEYVNGDGDLETALVGPHNHKSPDFKERQLKRRKQREIAEVINSFMFLSGESQESAAHELLDIVKGTSEPTPEQAHYLSGGKRNGDIEPTLKVVRDTGITNENALVKWARESGWLTKAEKSKERHRRAFGTHKR